MMCLWCVSVCIPLYLFCSELLRVFWIHGIFQKFWKILSSSSQYYLCLVLTLFLFRDPAPPPHSPGKMYIGSFYCVLHVINLVSCAFHTFAFLCSLLNSFLWSNLWFLILSSIAFNMLTATSVEILICYWIFPLWKFHLILFQIC